jgi:hypothetical protein
MTIAMGMPCDFESGTILRRGALRIVAGFSAGGASCCPRGYRTSGDLRKL